MVWKTICDSCVNSLAVSMACPAIGSLPESFGNLYDFQKASDLLCVTLMNTFECGEIGAAGFWYVKADQVLPLLVANAC